MTTSFVRNCKLPACRKTGVRLVVAAYALLLPETSGMPRRKPTALAKSVA